MPSTKTRRLGAGGACGRGVRPRATREAVSRPRPGGAPAQLRAGGGAEGRQDQVHGRVAGKHEAHQRVRGTHTEQALWKERTCDADKSRSEEAVAADQGQQRAVVPGEHATSSSRVCGAAAALQSPLPTCHRSRPQSRQPPAACLGDAVPDGGGHGHAPQRPRAGHQGRVRHGETPPAQPCLGTTSGAQPRNSACCFTRFLYSLYWHSSYTWRSCLQAQGRK